MPPRASKTPSRASTRASSQDATTAPARTPSRRGGRAPATAAALATPRTTRSSGQTVFLQLDETNRTATQQRSDPRLPALDEEEVEDDAGDAEDAEPEQDQQGQQNQKDQKDDQDSGDEYAVSSDAEIRPSFVRPSPAGGRIDYPNLTATGSPAYPFANPTSSPASPFATQPGRIPGFPGRSIFGPQVTDSASVNSSGFGSVAGHAGSDVFRGGRPLHSNGALGGNRLNNSASPGFNHSSPALGRIARVSVSSYASPPRLSANPVPGFRGPMPGATSIAQNPTTPHTNPFAGVLTAPRAGTPLEVNVTPEQIEEWNRALPGIPLPDSGDDSDLNSSRGSNGGGNGSPAGRGRRTGRSPPVNPFPSRSGSAASNNYSNRSPSHNSFHSATSRVSSRGGSNRGRNGPPGGNPPVGTQTAPARPQRPLTWWGCFLIESGKGIKYLSWTHTTRWIIVLIIESFLIRTILCSAGPICEQCSFWAIFWRYIWQDDWSTSFDFACRLVLYTMFVSQIFDCLAGMLRCTTELMTVRFDNPGRSIRHLLWYSYFYVRDIFAIIYDQYLEPVVILVLSIYLNYKAGPGDGTIACAIMFGVHFGKWIFQATEMWDRENFHFAALPRLKYKRWVGFGVLAVLIWLNWDVIKPTEEAEQYVHGGISQRSPTPTEVKNPVFNVTRKTSVTGDMMTVLNSILSASGLSPVTTGN